MTLSKIVTAATPVVAATALYFFLSHIGMPQWMTLTLTVSVALIIASLVQSVTICTRSGTRWWRSPALRKFGSDFVVSAVVAVPVAILLHARFLWLSYGPRAVLESRSWTGWLDTGGGINTIFFVFTVACGIAAFWRLVTRRFSKKKMT